jgi:hypothetical protein
VTASLTAKRLYELLPAIHRLRDAQQGEPLRDLISAFAQELMALEENLDQLYDDQFIETCADWVAPYIGELIGYRSLHGVAPKVASPRAEVANTIAYRRRKGTALMLEALARDVTSWPARAVECFEQLATTQYMKHPRLHAPATADLRDLRALLAVDGAFNRIAHTPEMRRPETRAGRFNLPNVGVFLWRLRAFRLSSVPLTPDPGDITGRRFRLNPLGADLRLFRAAQVEEDISHIAEPMNVPEPLSIRRMALDVRDAQVSVTTAPDARRDDDYGPGESLSFMLGTAQILPVRKIKICDLSDVVDASNNVIGWNHEGVDLAGAIGVDPERGRVLVDGGLARRLRATFHYGSVRAIGGGEYPRTPAVSKSALEELLLGGGSAQQGLDAVKAGGRLSIRDSLTYVGTPTFKVDADPAGIDVVVAAADGARPLIAANGDVLLSIGARGKLVLDGLVIQGGALRLPLAADTEPRELVLRDCTLVPGRTLAPDGNAVAPGAPSLVIEHPFAKVTLERCITGPLVVTADAEVHLLDSIVDAGSPENVAYAASPAGAPGGELSAEECTVIGKCSAKLVRLGSNCIFFARLGEPPSETWLAPFVVECRQEGCLRFSFVPSGSVTPRRHRCVPDTGHPGVEPHFTSLRYGDPGYAQLRASTDAAIRTGADDGGELGEMGVCHALRQPRREANLRIRLDEYLRFGLHAGIFYAT